MIADDPFSFRHIFNRSMAYGAVVFLLLCYTPVRDLLSEAVTAERLRETAGSIGGLVPVAMAVSAVVAGMVRKLLFLHGGVNRRSLVYIFLLGTFWHLPLTLLVAHSAAAHEPDAWQLPLYFTAVGAVASLALLCSIRRLASPSGKDN